MPRRLLNIASIACLVAGVALMTMWVRSYYRVDSVYGRFTDAQVFFIWFFPGRVDMVEQTIDSNLIIWPTSVETYADAAWKEHSTPRGTLTPLGFYASSRWELMLPYWFLVLTSGALTMLFRMSWPPRFTLRHLFIATTFLAVVLGMIAWLDRVWIAK